MPDGNDFSKMLQRARALMGQERWDKARRVLRRVRAADPPPIEKAARDMDDDCRTRKDVPADQEAARRSAGRAEVLSREAEERLRRAPDSAEALYNESLQKLERILVIFNRPMGLKGAFGVELTCGETLIAVLEQVEQFTTHIADIREVRHSNYFNTPTDNWMRYCLDPLVKVDESE